MKIQKKIFIFFLGGRGQVGRGEVRVDVIEELKFLGKIHKKKLGGRVGMGGGGGGQGGCERRIDVFVKIHKKKLGGGERGGQVGGSGWWGDVIKELKFLGKFTKKKKLGGGVGGGGVGGQGGCERIEVLGKIHKK